PPNEEDVWAVWVPEIVVKVVSPGSESRDYGEKKEEYLLFGVREYWIFDCAKREMLALRRLEGAWEERTLHPPAVYRTRLLPGLRFATGPVFEAADPP